MGCVCQQILCCLGSRTKERCCVWNKPLDHQTFLFMETAMFRLGCAASIAAVRTWDSVYQAVVGRRASVRTSGIRGPTIGGVAVSNLHGMTHNNQPTKTVLKYVISFCVQICTLTIIIIIIISLGIIALNAAWKFMIKTLVHGFNPVFDVVGKISKFIKMVGN